MEEKKRGKGQEMSCGQRLLEETVQTDKSKSLHVILKRGMTRLKVGGEGKERIKNGLRCRA
jgi:hypothetical protein